MTVGNTPVTGRKSPFNASSPKNTIPSVSACNFPFALSRLTATGKSNDEPSLRTYAGARLTVILCAGKSNALFLSALLTRSLDSLTAVSGKPTISYEGIPRARSVSTVTGTPSNPCKAYDCTLAIICSSPKAQTPKQPLRVKAQDTP